MALVGLPLKPLSLKAIEARLALAQLNDTKIVIHQSGDNSIDVTALKSSLLSDLYLNGQEALRKKDEQMLQLQAELSSKNALFSKADDIFAELRAQYPEVTSVYISEGLELASRAEQKRLIQMHVQSSRPLRDSEQGRVENWFKARVKSDEVMVNFVSTPRKALAQTKAASAQAKKR